MAFTYDVSSTVGKLRLMIADTQESLALFDDEEIDAIAAMYADDDGVPSLLLAGAQLLEIMAVDSRRTLKVVQVLDLKTDGAAVARAFRQQAAEWRTQAQEEDFDVEIIENLRTGFSWEERWRRLYATGVYC